MVVPNQIRVRKVLTLVVVFIGCVLAVFADESTEETDTTDDGRQMREYIMPETWHGIQTIPEGATGWIPRDSGDGHATGYTKRRRLRKRKRRPPIVSYLDQSAEVVPQVKQEQNLPPTNSRALAKRRKIPNTGDPWEELQEESVRPYIRRKVTPAYQTPSDDASSNPNPENDDDSIHYAINEKQDRFDKDTEEISFVPLTTTTKKTPLNIKEILKQNGGLSLSEILQRKNITLAELLMGKKEAIKALTETPNLAASTTTHGPHMTLTTQRSLDNNYSDTTKYKRLPPSIALRKENINRRYEQFSENYESLSDKEMKEAQRKRLSLLQYHSYKSAQNGKFSEVTRYEVITEPTTEKRIFVPSHPKLYTSVDYKPDLEDLTTNTETITTEKLTTIALTKKTEAATKATSEYPQVDLMKSKTRLPITSAKLMKMTTASSTVASTFATEEANYPKMTIKPLKINLDDVVGFQSSAIQVKEKVVPDEPLRMSIDLDTIVETSTSTKETPSPLITTTTYTEASTSKTAAQEVPKLKPYTAEDEILEILKDPLGRVGLARILEARNMTIQELIEHRERGSSQLHLADIFHNKTREPEPLDEALEGRVSSEVFTSFPIFSRRPKNLPSQEVTTVTSEHPSESTISLLRTAFPSFKIEVPKDPANTKEAFPWQRLYPDLFRVQDQNNNDVKSMEIYQQIAPLIEPTADILTEDYVQRLEDLDQSLFSSISHAGQQNFVDENPHKILDISSGVTSAIIASLAIVVLSIIVFMTILVMFKTKKKLYYGDSLKPPLFDVKPRNIKTFMAETLGRKKVNYYKRQLQSMSDDGWEKETRGESERKNVF